MKRVVGVSLGSSKRDSTSHVTILGEEFEISRIGTNGDTKRFAKLMQEFDGKADAIGLGGTDRYLWTDKRKYVLRDADKLARIAKTTPVADGSGVKNTLERKTIEYLQEHGIVNFADKNILVVCAVDRFGMAQTISKLAKNVVYGDLMFDLDIPIPMRSYSTVRLAAALFLPIICRLPSSMIYPTGKKQDVIVPKHQKYYRWADIVAGDFLLIKRTLPTPESGILNGKVIITNTVTSDDQQLLRDRGVRMLITSTPEYEGRRYGTNILEAIMLTLLGKSPEEAKVEDYLRLLEEMNWQPTITPLNDN